MMVQSVAQENIHFLRGKKKIIIFKRIPKYDFTMNCRLTEPECG